MCVEFFDTAGFHDNPGEIEAEGIRRTNELLKVVDLAIWVHDCSEKNKINKQSTILNVNKYNNLTQIIIKHTTIKNTK